MIGLFQKVDFIRRNHLFRGLTDQELNSVALMLTEKTLSPGEVIHSRGQESDRFHLLFTGKVVATRRTRGQQHILAEFVECDYFGEDALLKKKPETTTFTIKDDTTLLSLSRADFFNLLKMVPGLRSKLEVTAASHRLIQRTNFTWLEEGEIIFFVTQKHYILLVRSLTGPVLGLLLPVLALFLYLLSPGSGSYLWAAGLILTALAAWSFLKWLNWSNDYYIVTNQRVIFLDKVILIHDSRQEAPLTAILSINTQADVVGRTFGYGDVIIRTFVGNIEFKNIDHPEEVESLLREYWGRTKESSRQVNLEAMKDSIRQKLGLTEVSPPPPPTKLATKPAYSFNMFRVRFEEKGIITYRKHWIVLLKQTWLPGILALGVLVFIVQDLIKSSLTGKDSFFLTGFFFVFIPLGLWWLYQVIDWANDQFQVTEDQIFDIDRTPLGQTQKNVAPLDNILNLEARREGILQMMFNYGNVYISVGGAQMVFENVVNPDAVQQDIDQRRVARREKLEQERNDAERERLAEFFAAYHQNASTFQAEMEEKAREKRSDEPPNSPLDTKPD